MEPKALAAFIYYLKERETIRLRKAAGEPWPWTGDKILQTYSFTNVKRAHDKTTVAFVKHYREHYKKGFASDAMLLYNCAVSRYFGTIEFKREVGWLKKHNSRRLCTVAQRMMSRGDKVFTGAYIVTSAGRSGPKYAVVAEYLGGLWRAAEDIVDDMYRTRSWYVGYERMKQLPGFGGSGFMCKEVLQDFLLMVRYTIDDAEHWTPMGPGGRRGMNRLMGRDKVYRQPEAAFITEVQALHRQLAPWWLDTFPKAEPLTAHDVQFCLCEFDKYSRTRLKQGRPRSKYIPPSDRS